MKKRLLVAMVAVLTLALNIGGIVGGLSLASAQSTVTPKQAACEGVALTGGGTCSDVGPDGKSVTESKVNGTIALIINIFSLVVGVTAVIMVMIGGFKYVTSSGDSASVNSAKNTILYAIVGLIIVALAQIIVQFVLSKL